MKHSFALIMPINALQCGMPKRRDGIMTVRIPTDEKDLLQIIADQKDITLSDVVVQAVRDFIAANPVEAQVAVKSGKKPAAKPVVKSAPKAAAKGKSGKGAKAR